MLTEDHICLSPDLLASIGDVCRVSITKMISPRSGTEDGDSGKESLLSISAMELSLPGLYYIKIVMHTNCQYPLL